MTTYGDTVFEALENSQTHSLKGEQPRPDGVSLICGSAIKPEAIRWLWPEWLALGKLHILAGAPGQGKTTINLSFAATVTCGGRWPDGSRCEPGNVLIWSGEDDPSDTLHPRLLAMGGNQDRVFYVKGSRVNGEDVMFDPARDMVQLCEAAAKIGGVKLLMVDPIVSAVTGDSHKNTEVRRALQPLVDLAAVLDCAVVGISHFSKGTGGRDPTERVVGSVAFGAVARVVLVAAKVKDEDGTESRILARSKSNIGPDSGGYRYEVDQSQLSRYPGIFASRITWGEAVSGTARELLAERPDDGDDRSAKETAEEWLREELAGGATPTKMVEADAKAAGLAWSTVRRAADDVNVIRRKGGMNAGWYWSLPQPKVLKDAPKVLNLESEHLRDEMSTFGERERPDKDES